MNPYRKLIVLGLNEIIARGLLDLEGDRDTTGHLESTIAGKRAMILWHGIGFGETRISVWWDYDHSKHPQKDLKGSQREDFTGSSPLANPSKYPQFVGVVVGCWLERREGKYLQGKGGSHLFDKYCRRGMAAEMRSIPNPTPNGYTAEGKFHI